MNASRCPYLGLQEDPGTSLDFPSPGNFCHKASPPGPVRLDYQQSTCLAVRHARCPVFLAKAARPLPPALRYSRLPAWLTPRGLAIAGLALALLLLVSLGLAFGPRIAGMVAIQEPGSATQDTGFSLFPVTGRSAPQATATRTATPPRTTTCPMPEGWTTYTVNPTDTLGRLSVIHGVALDVLQQVNCLGNDTFLTPGQVIYIPITPTSTVTPTATATRFIPTWTFTPPPVIVIPAPTNPPVDEPPTDVPPTAAPPTAVPPTDVPPTDVPPTDVPPTAVPPTQPPPTASPPDNNDVSKEPKNKRNETIDCGGEPVTISGNSNTIELVGDCPSVTVTGNNNDITVPPGTPVRDTGNNNTIN